MADVKNVILAEGDEGRKLNEKTANSTKVRFLKKGNAFRGFFLTTKFVTYAQHGSFEERIQSHACLDPKAKKDCPSCAAGVKRAIKTLVFWYDVDAQEIVVRDVAKSAMAGIYAVLDTYGEETLTTLFNVSLGEKGAVNVIAVPPSKAKGVEPPQNVTIDEALLEYVMNVKSADDIKTLIAPFVAANQAKEGAGDGATIVRKDEGDVPF